jgi:uncharacterized protein (TIGR00266 family)
MKTKIIGEPAYSTLVASLAPGESITVEAGAMMAMEGEIEIKTKSGGLFKAIAGGEPLFRNIFTAQSPAEVTVSPPVPGDIVQIELGKPVIINSSCYLAHSGDVEFKTVWKGLKGVFGRGGLFWLEARGSGTLWLNSYGKIIEKVLRGGKLTADNTHLVSMDSGLSWKVRKIGGLKTFMFGGEGLVFDVEGQGRVYLQTRNPSIFFAPSR